MTEGTPLEKERRDKVARWRAEGREPYPASFPGRVGTDAVRAACLPLKSGEDDPHRTIRVAGR